MRLPRRAWLVRSALALALASGLAAAEWTMFAGHLRQAGLRARALALAGEGLALVERSARLAAGARPRSGTDAGRLLDAELGAAAARLEDVQAELDGVARAAAPQAGRGWAAGLAEPGGVSAEVGAFSSRLRRPAGARGAAGAAGPPARALSRLRARLEQESEDSVRRLRARSLQLLAAAFAALALLGAALLRPLWRALRRELSGLAGTLELVLENVPDGVVLVDRKGEVVRMNPAARRLLAEGDGDGAAAGAPGGAEPPVLRAMRGGTVVEDELHLGSGERPGGVWLAARASPVRGERGTVEGGLSILTDVTEVRALERELRAKSEELSRRDAEEAAAASMASHELQEPMRKIVAFGDRLRRRSGESLPLESLEDLGRMQGAALRMLRLLEALSRFSKVRTAGKAFEPVALDEVLADALAGVEPRIQAAGGSVARGRLPEVSGDRAQLELLFGQLLSNALAARREGAPLRVRVSAREAGGAWEVLVEDNGAGFAPEEAERLFEPFSRRRGPGRAFAEGAGLGLATCRRIAQRHGGAIRAEGRPGEGAAFVVRLPRAA